MLFISPRPLPQFPHILSLFVMFLCASPHKHRICVVLFISLRLPYPVCTRFICHVLCASPHKRRICVVLLISLRIPYPVCTRFCLSCFVCFALQTPGLCSALISLRLPQPVCTRFICHVLFASPHCHRFCAVLLSLVPLPFTQVLFILSVCFAPKTVQFYFPCDFCSLMRLLAFTVNL